MRSLGFVVAVDADPVHLAAAHDLILADDRDIVFRHAGDHAGVAAVAAVQVDGHAPGVARVGEFLVERIALGRLLVVFVGEAGILLVFLERAGAQDLAAFHVEVILRAGQRIVVAGLADLAARRRPRARSKCEPRRR